MNAGVGVLVIAASCLFGYAAVEWVAVQRELPLSKAREIQAMGKVSTRAFDLKTFFLKERVCAYRT